MLQQDLLDTLFLNNKALAGVGVDSDSDTSGRKRNAMTQDEHPKNRADTLPSDMTAGQGQGQDQVSSGGQAQCPVDHKTREAWLAQARARAQQTSRSEEMQRIQQAQSQSRKESCSSSSTSWWPSWPMPFSSSSPPATKTTPTSPSTKSTLTTNSPSNHHPSLRTTREVSTIPRSTSPGATTSACPVNSETETGADEATGNWVYPSEKMFFDAMRRKGHGDGVQPMDMRTVVPIHNAVNERAWEEIRVWEEPYQRNGSCPGGPRLHSFTGLSNKMSPKARINTLLGYTAPFDRHDWVVDRCGTKIEYVIDFYAGSTKRAPAQKGGNPSVPSFYLDVRPKLNSWEGAMMRARRALGLV